MEQALFPLNSNNSQFGMNRLSGITVLAAVAHPDDIEFLFSGTLILLRDAGCSIHMWNLADGSCGTLTHSRQEIVRLRAEEAEHSASIIGAQFHRSIFSDLEIFYDKASLATVAAVLRSIRPQIILTHSPDDYMEDHQNVCRLVTTATFSRAMPNFQTDPTTAPYAEPVRIYHAPPHGLHNGLNERFCPDFLLNVSSTMEQKREMLACHQSQFAWLEDSQGMNSLGTEMEGMCREIAGWGDGLEFAEAWRRHSHLGFCPPEFDPLSDLLASYLKHPKQNL
jgi:LmbE family N-acetylglucosaminyl deacetylase